MIYELAEKWLTHHLEIQINSKLVTVTLFIMICNSITILVKQSKTFNMFHLTIISFSEVVEVVEVTHFRHVDSTQ